MRELVVSTFVTLDGVMQAPGGPGEDDSGGFTKGGWAVPFWDDAIDAFMDEFMAGPFDLVLGRTTYEIFSSYWPSATEPGAEQLNAATKYVASRGRPALGWQKAVLMEGDVGEYVAGLKQEDGPELQVHGSADLLQTLIPAGLVDRFRVLTFPLVVGPGKRLFGPGTVPAAFRLVSNAATGTGVTLTVYEPAGDPTTGSFPLE
ncbi:dihydrofolate reductase family protein [Georgenia faecalis]|uniref:Dihydrofolate reductase family protein n=1 Tax=Georgenia faecalis TaxID=2483799 RepID=A0ABV9DAV2_9MICO|nr:dihydrofolate reductase family protein [Georgenia faecalis]